MHVFLECGLLLRCVLVEARFFFSPIWFEALCGEILNQRDI